MPERAARARTALAARRRGGQTVSPMAHAPGGEGSPRRVRPGVAACLGVVPGLGHLVVGAPGRAALFGIVGLAQSVITLAALLWRLFPALIVRLLQSSLGLRVLELVDTLESLVTPGLVVGLVLVLLTLSALSAHDAFCLAKGEGDLRGRFARLFAPAAVTSSGGRVGISAPKPRPSPPLRGGGALARGSGRSALCMVGRIHGWRLAADGWRRANGRGTRRRCQAGRGRSRPATECRVTHHVITKMVTTALCSDIVTLAASPSGARLAEIGRGGAEWHACMGFASSGSSSQRC